MAPGRRRPLIRKNLAERLPNLPKIDEVSKTPIPGLYEVRIGTEIFYTDEQGNYLIQGNLIDTKTRTDLTEARITSSRAIDFASLPLKDAVVIKQGNGTRKHGGVRRPELRLLQTLRARPGQAAGRDHLHLPVPDPRGRLQRQVARTSGARKDNGQGLARLDGRRRHAAQEHGPSATPPRSSATSSSARSTACRARRRWCSKTAPACPARSRWNSLEKNLAAATKKG